MRVYIFGLVSGLLFGLVYAKWVDIELGNELADCGANLSLETTRNKQLLSGGRFVLKLDKAGNRTYRFWVPPSLQLNRK